MGDVDLGAGDDPGGRDGGPGHRVVGRIGGVVGLGGRPEPGEVGDVSGDLGIQAGGAGEGLVDRDPGDQAGGAGEKLGVDGDDVPVPSAGRFGVEAVEPPGGLLEAGDRKSSRPR